MYALGWAMTDTADFAPIRYSTNDLPERERFSFLARFFRKPNSALRCEVTSDIERFHAEAELLVWPELRVLWSKEAPMHYSRSRGQAADGDNSLIFLLDKAGSSALSQRGQRYLSRSGRSRRISWRRTRQRNSLRNRMSCFRCSSRCAHTDGR